MHLHHLMPEEENPRSPNFKTMVIRYGYLREIGEFSDLTSKVGCGTKSSSAPTAYRIPARRNAHHHLRQTAAAQIHHPRQTPDYIEKSGGKDYPFTESAASSAPPPPRTSPSKTNSTKTAKHVDLACDLAARHHLPMKIIDVEHLLGGERILFISTLRATRRLQHGPRPRPRTLHTRIEPAMVGRLR